MQLKSMPMVENYVKDMVDVCRDEWFETNEGRQYQQQYEQATQKVDQLNSQMDAHIHKHLESKYGMIS